MQNLKAITGSTTDEMSKMEAGIRGIAKESGRSVIEIAANTKMLAEAGGDIDLVMEQLAHGTNLATATQTDMATTLDFLGSTMKTFGVEAEDTQAVVDSFALVTSLANVDLSQLGEAFVNVGGAAADAGLGIDDVNAMLVTLANAGMKGGAAGTSLNAVLRNLSTPTATAAKALNELGVALYDSNGESRDMMLIMKDLEGSLSGLTDEQRRRYESVIFDTVAQRGWNMLVADGIDSVVEMSGELSNAGDAFDGMGQAAGMAETQMDTLQGGLDKLKARAQDLGISFYKTVQGPLKDGVKKATGYMDQLSTAFSEGGLTGLVSALGNVFSEVVTEIVAAAPKMVDAAVGLLKALIAGIQENIPVLAQGAVSIVTSLIEGIAALLPQLAIAAVQLITALVDGIGAALPTLIPVAVNAIVTLVQGLIDNAPMLLSAALQLIMGLADGLLAALPQLIEALPAIIMAIVNYFLGAIPQLIDAGIHLLTSLVEALPQIIASIVEVIPLIIDGIITAVLDALPLIIQAGIDLLVALVQALPYIITTIVKSIPQIIGGIIDALIGNIDKIIMAGVELFIALIENLPTIIIEIVKAIPQIITGIVEALGSLAWKIVEAGGNLIKGLWDGIKNMASWLWDKISGFFSDIWDGILGFFGIHSPSKLFAGLGENLILGMNEGISSEADTPLSTLTDTGEEMINGLVSVLEGGGNELESATYYIMDMMTNAVIAMAPGFIQQWVSMFNTVIGKTETWANNMTKSTYKMCMEIAAMLANLEPPVKISIPAPSTISIPRLAHGGLIPPNQPQLVMVGDNRREEEIVSPRSAIREEVKNAIKEMGGIDAFGGGPITLEGDLNVDGQTLARIVLPLLEQEQRRKGNRIQARLRTVREW